jgi:hypothetical protein
LAGLAEDLAHALLGLADPLREQLGTLDADEVDAGLVGQRLGQQRLPRTGRAVEEQSFGRFDADPVEDLGLALGTDLQGPTVDQRPLGIVSGR